jgi:hypothetical protein
MEFVANVKLVSLNFPGKMSTWFPGRIREKGKRKTPVTALC